MTRLRTHPGEVLREEYLVPLGLSAAALARAIQVSGNRIGDILRERRDICADTAIRPANTSASIRASGSICSRPTISRSPSTATIIRACRGARS